MAEKASMSDAWRLARQPDVVRRAAATGIIVGGILVLINYGDTILSGSLTTSAFVKIALTVCVPYCVSTYSSVAAMLQYAKQ